jgi:hypothetical protein
MPPCEVEMDRKSGLATNPDMPAIQGTPKKLVCTKIGNKHPKESNAPLKNQIAKKDKGSGHEPKGYSRQKTMQHAH